MQLSPSAVRCQTETVLELPSRVLLVRHGETEWNRERRRQGRLDSPLTPRGRLDAEASAETCAGLAADSIFSSPLGRARETASVVSSALSMPVVVLDELAEIDHGAFAGLTTAEIEQRHPGLLAQRNISKYTWSFPGGESYADARVRGTEALRTIVATGASSPVLVTHEMIGRVVLQVLLGLDAEQTLLRSLPHGSVVEVRPATGETILHSRSPHA